MEMEGGGRVVGGRWTGRMLPESEVDGCKGQIRYMEGYR